MLVVVVVVELAAVVLVVDAAVLGGAAVVDAGGRLVEPRGSFDVTVASTVVSVSGAGPASSPQAPASMTMARTAWIFRTGASYRWRHDTGRTPIAVKVTSLLVSESRPPPAPGAAATASPPGYPEGWEADILLKDGSTAHLRPILPSGRAGRNDLLERMSLESVYHRFFRVKHELTPEELTYFTELDYRRRMAFVVERGGRIIGVGRYDDTKAEHAAEVAFAVDDDEQGKGIGSRLLEELTAYARLRGITAFRAYVLADNHAMIRVFRGGGFKMRREMDEGVFIVEFPTEESDETRAAAEEKERRATAASITPLMFPYGIAVIGASTTPGSIGARLFANLQRGGFTGELYPVNPNAAEVGGLPAYPAVGDIPGVVDLAFIVVPAPLVIDVARQCGAKGVRGIVVISAGFGETGAQGMEAQNELLEIVRSSSMRMVGPNCMGLVNTNPAVKLDGQFGPVHPLPGNVAMSSQSGALGIALLDYATNLNIGISSFVSVGNKADISGNDLLLYWEDDPETDVIVLYLESFGNPRRFGRLARRITRNKPIVAVKSGRTAAGARAASSHTGSLASLDIHVDALFRQAGVIRTESLGELFDVTALLANQPLPQGQRVGLVSNAGGPAILAVDALAARGLEIVEFSDSLQSELRRHLAPDASVRNPVDMIASAGPEQYRACLDAVLGSDEVDAVVAMFIPASPEGADAVAAAIAAAGSSSVARDSGKSFIAVYMSADGATGPLADDASGIPVYAFPEQAARALARAVEYSGVRSRDLGNRVRFDDVDHAAAAATIAAALRRFGDEGGWLEPAEVADVLTAYGLQLPKSGRATTAAEAVDIAAGFDGPAVLKVIADSALHKSDVGGIVLDVSGDQAVRAAFEQVTGAVADAEGALVQEFVPGGHEVLIGLTQDPVFGPLIVFGLGGIFVELIGDVAFRILPLTDIEAGRMIREVKSSTLLEGYRGGPAGDVPALEEALLRVAALGEDFPEISEMDLNPVKVAEPGEGVVVVDGRINVEPVAVRWMPNRELRSGPIPRSGTEVST